MRESSTTDADTSISTNGDYSVFVNQPKDFVLKLTLHEADSSSSQIRIVELASIFDEELNKASYEKLVDLIVAAVGFDFNTNALKLTYQDYDNDAVVVSSTRELTYAIRQFYDERTIKFVGNIQQGETPIKNQEANVKNTLPSVVVSSAVPAAAVPAAAPATAYSAATWTLPTPHQHAVDAKDFIPTDFAERVAGQVDFPTIRFDASRVAPGLALDHDNRRVTQTVNLDHYKCVFLKDGITSGSKYWSFKILDKATNRNIIIGVSTYPCPPAPIRQRDNYPVHTSDSAPGCSLNLSNGHFYSNNRKSSSVNYVQNATVFGVLLNMDHKTVTFYADGKRVGVGAGSNELTGQEYFPVIALYELGHSVEVMDFVQPAASHDH